MYHAKALLVMKDLGLRDRILRMLSSIGPYAPSMDTQIQMMRQSKELRQEVAKRVNIELKKEPILQKKIGKVTASQISSMVSIGQGPGANVLEVIARHPNKRLTVIVASAFAVASVKANKELAAREYKLGREYLEDQLEVMKERLATSEEKLRRFNQKYGVVEYEQALEREYDRYRTFQDELERLKMEEEAQASLQQLLQKKASEEEPLLEGVRKIPNPKREMLSQKLFSLQLQLEDLRERFTEAHPRVRAVEKKIKRIEHELQTKVPKYVTVPDVKSNPMYEFWQQKLADRAYDSAVRKIRIGDIASLQKKAEKKLQVLGMHQVAYAQLLREVKNNERIVNSIQDMLEQMKVTEKTQAGNLSIIDRPTDAEKITAATPARVGLSLVISLLAAVVASVVVEFVDDRLRTAHAVRRYLNLPVVGSIPRVHDPDRRLIYKIEQRAPIVEAYHKVCFQFESLCLDKNAKTILLTSIRSEEGKTTVLANMATSLAREGERVLLVDGDVRKPALHRMLGVSNTVGLTSIMKGEVYESMEESVKAVIQPTPVERLFLISGGPPVSNPVELLRSEKLPAFVKEVRKHADMILFDSSPLAAVIDPVIIGSCLDGILLLIDASQTKRKEALTAKQQLLNLKIHILGVVLNNSLADEEDYYYYYYYSGYAGERLKKSKSSRLA